MLGLKLNHVGKRGYWRRLITLLVPWISPLNRLFRRRSKLRVTGLCAGNSPVTGEFSAQMISNAKNVSIWWCHHVAPSDRTQSHRKKVWYWRKFFNQWQDSFHLLHCHMQKGSRQRQFALVRHGPYLFISYLSIDWKSNRTKWPVTKCLRFPYHWFQNTANKYIKCVLAFSKLDWMIKWCLRCKGGISLQYSCRFASW